MDNEPLSPYESASEPEAFNWRDFWIGFVGWWVINICAGTVQSMMVYGAVAISPNMVDGSTPDFSSMIGLLSQGLGCLVMLANIAAIVYFLFKRKYLAFGILAAFGLSIAITLCLGLLFMVGCFVLISAAGNR